MPPSAADVNTAPQQRRDSATASFVTGLVLGAGGGGRGGRPKQLGADGARTRVGPVGGVARAAGGAQLIGAVGGAAPEGGAG